MKVVGKGLIRPDAYDKVLGKILYPDDIEMEGMLYGGVIRSTIANGEVSNINIEFIRSLPGVKLVIDYSMIPGAKTHGVILKDIPVLVKDRIKRVGDAILLIVAESKSALALALKSAKVEYKEYEGVFSIEEALREGAPIIGENSNILATIKIKTGDVEAGYEQAKFIVENTYNTPRTEHAFLQPEAVVAAYDGEGVLEIYVATQYPHYDREEVARCLNLEEDVVRIRNTAIGGAFGAREDINPQCHAALGAYFTKKPVKIVYSREESTISHSKRHPMKMVFKTGVNAEGKLCALKARIYGDTGAYASWGINVLRKAAIHATGPYVIPNVDIEAYAVYTNNPYSGAMRGFGAAQVPIAYEGQMELLAEKLNMHPLKFRYINAFEEGSFTATGQKLSSSVGIKKCIEKIMEIDNLTI